MEKGERRITLSEAAALAAILRVSLDDLVTPPALLEQQRAKEIADEVPLVWEAFAAAIVRTLELYREFQVIANDSEDLREYMVNHMNALGQRLDERAGADLPHVTDEEIADLQVAVERLWTSLLWVAQESAHREIDPSLRPEEA